MLALGGALSYCRHGCGVKRELKKANASVAEVCCEPADIEPATRGCVAERHLGLFLDGSPSSPGPGAVTHVVLYVNTILAVDAPGSLQQHRRRAISCAVPSRKRSRAGFRLLLFRIATCRLYPRLVDHQYEQLVQYNDLNLAIWSTQVSRCSRSARSHWQIRRRPRCSPFYPVE